MAPTLPKRLRTLAPFSLLIIPVAIAVWFFGPSNLAGMGLATIRMWLIPVIIPAIIIVVVLVPLVDRFNSGMPLGVSAWVLGLVIISWLGGLIVYGTYIVPRGYTASIEYTEGDPTYTPRAPFVLAEALADRDLQGVVGDRQEVNYLANDSGTYTALVNRRGFAKGYEAVQVITPAIIGSSPSSDNCTFSLEAGLRAGGTFPGNNLKRAIRGEVSMTLRMNTSDAYAYCDGDTPMVVWPTTRLAGWFPAIDVPAGAVVYNGQTGEITHHDEVPEEIPGPSYPLSVATKQRDSTSASGSLADLVFNRAGFESTTGDLDDPNGENATEMLLSGTAGDDAMYVTPLTPRGGSQSIVALSEVNARGTTGLAPMVIHELTTARVANSTIDGRLRSEYAELPWASGMKVFEVAPGDEPGTWVASIGQRQDVTIRAMVSADGSIRLVQRGDSATEKDTSGENTGTSSGGSETLGPDLSQMSNAEIRDLIDKALDEITERSQG